MAEDTLSAELSAYVRSPHRQRELRALIGQHITEETNSLRADLGRWITKAHRQRLAIEEIAALTKHGEYADRAYRLAREALTPPDAAPAEPAQDAPGAQTAAAEGATARMTAEDRAHAADYIAALRSIVVLADTPTPDPAAQLARVGAYADRVLAEHEAPAPVAPVERAAEHTPGPWRWQPVEQITTPGYAYQVSAAQVPPWPVAQVVTPADAQLVAAAPALLAACNRVLRAIEWAYTEDRLDTDEQAAVLRAAIESAAG